MDRGKAILRATPVLIGISFLLSACAANPGYDSTASAYDYGYPVYGSLDFDYWGGWGDDWHHHRDHSHGGGWRDGGHH